MLTQPFQVLASASNIALTINASLLASDGSSESVPLEAERDEGTSVYGYTRYYSFSLPVHQDKAYTALEVERDAASQASFQLQNDVFVVPSRTAVEGSKAGFTVAARTAADGGSSSGTVDVGISAPARQQGTLAPKVTVHGADAKQGAAVPGYQLWEGSVDLGAPVTGAVAVSAAAGTNGGDVVRDVLYVSAGVAGW